LKDLRGEASDDGRRLPFEGLLAVLAQG
jgi:hypothetical protein